MAGAGAPRQGLALRLGAAVAAPHWPSSSPDSSNVEAKPFLDDEERLQNGNGNGSVTKYEEEDVERILSTRLDLRTFWQYVRYEVSLDVRYGFAQLALFYVLINNLVRMNTHLTSQRPSH